MGKLSPPNPRNYLPSRAHPEHRSRRKELEKEHPFGWTEPLVLGMLGIGLAWNIEKQVQKHEERKDREEQEAKEKEERRRRRRERQIRDGTFDPANHDRGSESMSRSSAGRSREDRDRQREKERRGIGGVAVLRMGASAAAVWRGIRWILRGVVATAAVCSLWIWGGIMITGILRTVGITISLDMTGGTMMAGRTKNTAAGVTVATLSSCCFNWD